MLPNESKDGTGWRVADHPYNRVHAPDLIGKVFEKAPSYLAVEYVNAETTREVSDA